MLSTRKYKYSDIGFYLIKDLVENLTNQSLDEYVTQTFYEPLGLTTATYNPWKTQNFKPNRSD